MNTYKIKHLTSSRDAQKVIDFLFSKEAFDMEWAPGEKDLVHSSVLDSLKNKSHTYWYVVDDGNIVGAVGIRENEYKSGGYEATTDYFAVHQAYRRKGIGNLLLDQLEAFVRERKGRYILIETCDTDAFLPARKFYAKHGYNKVGYIPDYYSVGEGKVDYLKYLPTK